MIDYEKLKIAHELLENAYDVGFIHKVRSKTIIDEGCQFFELMTVKHGTQVFMCLDDLINKLKEPTKPEPTYAVGQLVWQAGFCGKISSWMIESIEPDTNQEWCYRDPSLSGWFEHQLYPTRESLIKSQIMYWHGLQFPERLASCCSVHAGGYEECPKECEHEHDGHALLTNPPQYKCKKCGGFCR